MARSWLIGSDPACDLVVDHQTVSARHCRLTAVGDAGYLLEDNGSTNGTFVDGRRITAPWRVSRDNRVTLGRSQPMPWPDDLPTPAAAATAAPTWSKVLTIGREPDNDLVVNLPTVSGHHARVLWSGRPGEAEIEDLGSSNGTSVGAPDRRSARAVVTANDTIYLGMYPLPAARVFEALETRSGESGVRLDPAVPAAEPFGSVVAREWRAAWRPAWKPLVFVALGALAGGLAVASAGFDARLLRDPAAWAGAAHSLAALLSRMGLLAVGLGLAVGVSAGTSPAANRGGWLVRAWVAAVVCLGACLLEWGTVQVLTGTHAGRPAALGLLWMGSGVGLALGLVAAAIAPRPVAAWAAVVLLAIPLWGLGGESTTWVRLPGWAKEAAGVNPSRWTFEGLLLIASERVRVPNGTGAAAHGDLAEPYFPVETARTGPLAVTLALGAMLLGWGAVAAFMVAETQPVPLPPPPPHLTPPVGRPAT